MINQQTSIAKNVSSSRPKSGVSRQGVPRRPTSASMASKKPKGSVQFLETPKAPPENKSLKVGGAKVMNIHTEQARMHLKAPSFIAAVAESNHQKLLTEAKTNDLNRSMNSTSLNTSYGKQNSEAFILTPLFKIIDQMKNLGDITIGLREINQTFSTQLCNLFL